MFTGIIETMGKISRLEKERGNLHITIQSDIARELKVDQSLAHNGVCLTVVAVDGDLYTVTAIDETLQRSNLGTLEVGSHVNLERAMVLGARLDGHLVQGHVDQMARCTRVEEADGSWVFHFEYETGPGEITIEKGSITVDGVSLTVVDSGPGTFSVAIIPYTYEHTRFGEYREGSLVNLEFDMIGKYVARLLKGYDS
jgi:riboflavin synthase